MSTVIRVHYHTVFGDFITIRGSSNGLSWDIGHEMTWTRAENQEDVWVLSLGNLQGVTKDDVIRFKPLINDEVWAKGVDYFVRAGETIDIYPFFLATTGTVFKAPFESELMGNSRKLAVYLPPSYEENPYKRYPVIFFNDGHNLFDTEDSFCGDTWQLREAMDTICCNGSIQEQIVVGIYPLQREFEYLPTAGSQGNGGGADIYLDMIAQELRTCINAELRTTGACAIAGSSYGGLISLYAWVTRPNVFSVCGAFSPSLRFDNGVVVDIVKEKLRKRPDVHKLYMDCGSLRDGSEPVKEMAKHLQSDPTLNKDQFLFVLGEGHEHKEKHWAIRTPGALKFMFPDPQRVKETGAQA